MAASKLFVHAPSTVQILGFDPFTDLESRQSEGGGFELFSMSLRPPDLESRQSRVDQRGIVRHPSGMSTLAEIEQAADALPPEQKQELMLFLAARLRAEGARLPEPRKFSRQQIETWIAEDEAELRRFKPQG